MNRNLQNDNDLIFEAYDPDKDNVKDEGQGKSGFYPGLDEWGDPVGEDENESIGHYDTYNRTQDLSGLSEDELWDIVTDLGDIDSHYRNAAAETLKALYRGQRDEDGEDNEWPSVDEFKKEEARGHANDYYAEVDAAGEE